LTSKTKKTTHTTRQESTDLAKIEQADIELAEMRREERIKEIKLRMMNPKPLSSDEYIALLEEVEKNYASMLATESMKGGTKGTGGIMYILEKVRNLLDSMKGKYGNVADKSDMLLSLQRLENGELMALRATLVKMKGPRE